MLTLSWEYWKVCSIFDTALEISRKENHLRITALFLNRQKQLFVASSLFMKQKISPDTRLSWNVSLAHLLQAYVYKI